MVENHILDSKFKNSTNTNFLEQKQKTIIKHTQSL